MVPPLRRAEDSGLLKGKARPCLCVDSCLELRDHVAVTARGSLLALLLCSLSVRGTLVSWNGVGRPSVVQTKAL